jgi:hypothetical protein
MKKTWVACGVAGLVAIAGTALSMGSATALAPPAPRPPTPPGRTAPPAGTAPTTTTPTTAGGLTSSTTTNGVTITISGGHETDARDGGRPVVLVAAALGVPTEVFRTAFSGVTPSRTGGPTEAEAQANKAALLRVLAPYGITNERLDAVSNYYRYLGSAGQMWTTTLATATATVVNGRVTGITITNPGAGYSSTPTVTVTGAGSVTATATVTYTTDFATNGSISAITIR